MALIENAENRVLITTTVSVDAQKTGAQVTLHLIQGDAGTRRIQFVPISGGRQISLANVSGARVRAVSLSGEPLLINCTIEDGAVYMVPTAALVQNVDEWACQLVLLNSDDETLSSMPFTILTHGTVYDGDAVEHTNKELSAIYFDSQGRLTIELADGTVLVADKWVHTHDLATATKAGFLSAAHYTLLTQLAQRVNQDVRTTASPTFAGLTIGSMTISGDGTITGLRFT
jgi:hypothetical protein